MCYSTVLFFDPFRSQELLEDSVEGFSICLRERPRGQYTLFTGRRTDSTTLARRYLFPLGLVGTRGRCQTLSPLLLDSPKVSPIVPEICSLDIKTSHLLKPFTGSFEDVDGPLPDPFVSLTCNRHESTGPNQTNIPS